MSGPARSRADVVAFYRAMLPPTTYGWERRFAGPGEPSRTHLGRYCDEVTAARLPRWRPRMDPQVLHADHISGDTGTLTVNGRQQAGLPATIVVDLNGMSDSELLYAAHAFLTVLYARFPREAALIDRTHEGAA